jgi:hypothetical protein
MAEHLHLLLSEPLRDTFSDGTASLKPKDGLNGPSVRLNLSGDVHPSQTRRRLTD